MFWLAFATQISASVAENANVWFNPQDVPEYLLRQGSGLWQVPIRITVNPDGRMQKCEIERTSGIADLDRLTCRIVLMRAKFKPASIDGTASFGVYRASIQWAVADVPWDTSKISNPDVDVTVERLPDRVTSPALVKVMFAVDASGNKSSCTADEAREFVRATNHPALVSIACDQIVDKYQATPALDQAGKPISSIQNGLVRFSTTKPPN